MQGLSTELGAFVAGVMLSATDQQEHALSQLEHIKHFFLSLFIASTGLVMSPGFLMQHLRVLAGKLLPPMSNFFPNHMELNSTIEKAELEIVRLLIDSGLRSTLQQ